MLAVIANSQVQTIYVPSILTPVGLGDKKKKENLITQSSTFPCS